MNSTSVGYTQDAWPDRTALVSDGKELCTTMPLRAAELGGEDWDQFVEAATAESCQQTDAWAQAKRTEGWDALKRVLAIGGRKVAGYQMFFKPSKVGVIGYVPGGPIPVDRDPENLRQALEQVIRDAKDLRLRVVIQQCTGSTAVADTIMSDLGFLPNRLLRIVTATWVIPVSDGMQAVEKRMQATKRRHVRNARRNGVVVQEGTRSDIAEFHELMEKSCERQGVRPNPGSPKFLEALWNDSPNGLRTHIFFAEHEGRRVAAVFCICLGTRVHIWKKGNDPESLNLRAGDLLYYDILKWAHQNGYETVDHEAMNRGTAEHILAGRPLTEEIKRSRDYYAICFGGHPELMAEPRIWIRNPVLRMIYKLTACSPIGSRLLASLYKT